MSKALRDLAALDIQPDIAAAIVKEMPKINSLRDSWKVPLSVLTRKIPVSKVDPLESGGVIAMVGPTGVGKTTTIAKLAARFAMKHGARNVALVSTDTYRIGAREQLHTYARILNVPMHVAQDREDLTHVLDAVAGRKLVLIDTAGMSQRDMRLSEQFATLERRNTKIDVVLALSATSDVNCLDETIRLFSKLRKTGLMGCVLTKIDEAASLGAPLSTIIRHNLPLLHLCTGQRVPEDLHPARGKHAWLVETAMKLRRASGRVADENFMAEQFGKVAVHA
jgi:flagellar biosynthesis protein FlhF